MKTAIVSFWMSNIPPDVIKAQASVVAVMKSPDQYFLQFHTTVRHGAAIDAFLKMNEEQAFRLGSEPIVFDTVILLDIDAIPLDNKVLPYLQEQAEKGVLVGNVQRSNHIDNNQHLFVAPSCMAFSVDIWRKAGKPSFLESIRGDVAEEFTFLTEENNISEVELAEVDSYDMPPVECPFWNLREGMPVYGRSTTFKYKNGGKVFHQFQIWDKASQKAFVNKCKETIGGNAK